MTSCCRNGENRCLLFWAQVPPLQQPLGLSSDGGTKIGTEFFFFFNFSFFESREFFYVVPVIAATSVCSSSNSTGRCAQVPGASNAGIASCGTSHPNVAAAVPLCSMS